MTGPSRRATWLLTWLILAGLVGGVLVGQLLHDGHFDPAVHDDAQHAHAAWLAVFSFFGKTIFMRLLKLMIVPLIIASVVAGVAGVGDVRRLGGMGLATLSYYFSTMLAAVTLGLVLVNLIQPGRAGRVEESALEPAVQVAAGQETRGPPAGDGARQAYRKRQQTIERGAQRGIGGVLQNLADQVLPPHGNIIQAAVEGRMLALIFFSLFLGLVLAMLGPRGRALQELFEALFAAMMVMVQLVIWLAPAGVFCLLAWTVARMSVGQFVERIGLYVATVLAGLAIHGLGVLPLVLWVFGRVRPWTYLVQMRQALMTAFGTDSSSATLPVTMECAVLQGGCSKRSAGFVLPLGATINMDGTALYEAVAVAFLFQYHGIELGLEQMLIIALTATLAAVGAAGIPEAGLFTMAIVVVAVNHSLAGTGKQLPFEAIGLIIGVDRLLDMCRTTVNVWGDAVGAKIISRIAPDPPGGT